MIMDMASVLMPQSRDCLEVH